MLKTKLCVPPSRPNLVPRARLIAKLDDGLRRGHRMSLVSAPAGSGKTTLLGTWLHHLADAACVDRDAMPRAPIGVTWLALDQADNEPARFWMYLIGALQTIDANLGCEAQRLLAAPRRPLMRRILFSLLNDLAAYPKIVVLILDDYQAIAASAIHKDITFFADHAPPQLHLVLSSRVEPPLPIARFRARDQLTELRVAELHFTPEETATFLASMTGMRWRPAAVQALHGCTEGWIAGLQIAGLELQRLLAASPHTCSRGEISRFIAGFSGRHPDIRDFIEAEVLTRQSQHVQAFLTVTSILEQLNGSLCDAITGQPGSQALLEQLEEANVFLVPLDGARSWYRYHTMFADVLRDRLQQAPPQLLPILHRRAAEWYAAHGYAAEAIEHQRCAEHSDRAGELDNGSWARVGASALLLEDHDLISTHVRPDDAIEVRRAPAAEQMYGDSALLPPRACEVQGYPPGKWWDQTVPKFAWLPAGAPLVERLTARELTVLRLVAEGLTYTQISRRLVIGLNTVRFHVKNIYGKLNVHSRTQAIVRAKQLRLLPE